MGQLDFCLHRKYAGTARTFRCHRNDFQKGQKPLHPLPQQHSSRMIHRQLLFWSKPHPPPQPLLLPQQLESTRRRISVEQQLPPNRLEIPPEFSHPHPQFEAAKSLMVKPPIFYTLHSMKKSRKCAFIIRESERNFPAGSDSHTRTGDWDTRSGRALTVL